MNLDKAEQKILMLTLDTGLAVVQSVEAFCYKMVRFPTGSLEFFVDILTAVPRVFPGG